MNGQENQNKPLFKPLYMEDVEEKRGTNGFNVVSTFSGCGGSCLGFELAGYNILYANEFIPAAHEVYKLNHPNTYLDTNNIRKVEPEDILKQISLEKGQIDVLEGSPPCASFSTCGLGSKGWNQIKKYSDTKQRVDDLFFEYIRILKGLMPKVFIAENVKGLIQGHGKGYFKIIMKELKDSGYNVKAKLINAVNLEVPQTRERVIIIGTRKDLDVNPSFPKPLNHVYTIKDAFPDFEERKEDKSKCWWIKGKTKYLWHHAKIGESLDKPAKRLLNQNIFFTQFKLNPNKPCPTIKQGKVEMYHPIFPRSISIAEMLRLFTFPEDFKMLNKFSKDWERLGRSVPPKMMYHIAKTIRDDILCKM